MRFASLLLVSLSLAAPAFAQQTPTQMPNDGKIRVFINDSESWEVMGGWGYSGRSNYGTTGGSSSAGGGGFMAGGARPQTAEIIKTFNQRCPSLTITGNRDMANYAVILDHEGGKAVLRHKDKIAVFNRIGDVIFSNSTLSVGGSVKDACAAIENDAPNRARPATVSQPTPPQAATQSLAAAITAATPVIDATTSALLGVSGYSSENGFNITSVRAGSPAADAYFRAGDTIAKIDGRDVHTGADVESAARASGNGTVKVSYLVHSNIGMMGSEKQVKVR